MGIVSEYEQITSIGGIPTDQPEENQHIVKRVQELLARAKRHRKRYDADWHYNYEFVCSGRQWPIDRPRWRFSEVINLTWADIMTEIAIQTDARPDVDFSSQEWTDESFVDVLKDVHNRNWDKYKWNMTVCDGLFDCKLYHAAHWIVEWNPDFADGLGDVDWRIMDPFYCYWDPVASDVNKGRPCRWFIYAEPRPTSWLKDKYPAFKDKIKPDVSLLTTRQDWSQGTPGRVYTNFDPYSPSRLPSSATASGELYGGEPHTQYIRVWMRDDTMEELTLEKDGSANLDTEGTQEKEFLLKKKYPTGRYIEICNNELLRDTVPGIEINGEWVPYDTDKFPIVRLVNYQYPREYAGENECTHIKGPAKINNYFWSYILDTMRMMGSPITILGDGADVDDEEVTNEPGSILHAADVNQVRRESGPGVAPGLFDLLKQATGFKDKIQGLQDVTRGAESSYVQSGIMLEGYVEAAQTRPRMKNRNLEAALQDAGELILLRYMQFYTQPRMWRITSKEGYPQFIEFYMPDVEVGVDPKTNIPITKKVAKIRKQTTMPDGSQQVQTSQTDVKGMPDVRVTTGSALPFAKAQKSQTALSLFNAGAIDQEALLDTIDWPDYEEVIKRMQAQAQAAQQAKAQAAQQAQQGKGAPPPPPGK